MTTDEKMIVKIKKDLTGWHQPTGRWQVIAEALETPLVTDRIVEYRGNKYTIKELAKISGLNVTTLDSRINKLHWPINIAVETPLGKKFIKQRVKPLALAVGSVNMPDNFNG